MSKIQKQKIDNETTNDTIQDTEEQKIDSDQKQIHISEVVNNIIDIFQTELFAKYDLEPINLLKENLNYDSLDDFKKSLSDQIKKINIKPKKASVIFSSIPNTKSKNEQQTPKIYF